MGSFYGCVYTRGVDAGTVRDALLEICRKRPCNVLLAPEIRGWIAIYPHHGGQDESIAKDLARRLKTAEILYVTVHDSDIFAYHYYRNGRRVDQYNSWPDYFGSVSPATRRAQRGKPEALRPLLGSAADMEALRAIIDSRHPGGSLDADAQFDHFAELLGLPNHATAYDYLMRSDEDDRIERRAEFVHVPDLGPALAEHAAARARANAELEGLGEDGPLLLTRSPAPSAICPEPGRPAFLAVDLCHPEPCEVYRLAEPWSACPSSVGLTVDPPRSIAISPSGRFLAVGLFQGWKTELWDLENRKVLFTVPRGVAHFATSFTPDERTLVSAGDVFIRLDSIPEGAPIRSLSLRSDPSRWSALHPTALMIACIRRREDIAVFDLSTGSLARRFLVEELRDTTVTARLGLPFLSHSLTPADQPKCLLFSRDGRSLFCGTNRGVWIYDWQALLASDSLYPIPLRRHQASRATFNPFSPPDRGAEVLDMAQDAAGNRLLMASGNGIIRQMDLASGEVTVLLAIPEPNPVTRLGFSGDGALLYTVESPRLGNTQRNMDAFLQGGWVPKPLEDDRPDILRIWDYRGLSKQDNGSR